MKKFSCLIPCFSLILLFFFTFSAYAQQSVIMQHNDIGRTGWFNKETFLSVNNVKAGSFGKIFERAVDDQMYAQPLILSNVNIPGSGIKNILIAATVNNSVYAFDADSAAAANPYWQVSLTAANSRPVKNTDMTGACGGGYRDFSGNMGTVGTPAIDSVTNTLYVVARSLNTSTGTYTQYLHALDVRTGAEKFNGPKLITASVNGHGDGNINGKVNFDPQKNNQRPGLLLANGIVYIAWSSHCDWGPYHGWIIGYDMATLEQKIVYNTTPEGYNGGIWMSGAGPSLDENGNIYVAVGNGSVGRNNNPSDPINRSESAIKLTPSGSTLSVNSFFSPRNIDELEGADLDFGVTQILLIPGTSRALAGCKDGKIYLLDRDNMGGFNAGSNNVIQTIDLGSNSHLRSSFTYFKGSQKEFIYSWSENALLKAFPYDRSTNKFDLNNTVSSGVQGPVGNSGAMLSLSSNGSADTTAILWASYAANGDANQSVRPGMLRAFDANDITKELWNTAIYPSDNPGNYAKFNCPVIANGKVYLATFSNKLAVYGLINGPVITNCSSSNVALNKPATASSSSNANLYPAADAVDGNLNTYWNSGNSDPQSIYVDLGKRYDLCRIILKWENVQGKSFALQVSDDAMNWSELVNVTANTEAENNFPVTAATGRYVRMLGTSGASPSGYSLNEMEVYGNESTNQCAGPVKLGVTDIYETSASLHWTANGASLFEIQYKTVSASAWISVMTDTSFIKLNSLSCANDYLFRVRSTCGPGDSSLYSAASSFSTLPCNSNCGPLPTRWTTLDIGNTGAAGSACFANGIFELHGSGNDIWDTQDAFRYAYKTFVGDGEIIARVVSMDNSNPWNKCGIMFRESLAPGSRNLFVALTSGNGAAFQNRLETDGYCNNLNTGPGISVPYWIKLVKQVTAYTAYISQDGTAWTALGNPVDAGFGAGMPIYAGLALTSHNDGILSVATVDNYLLGGAFQQFNLQRFTGSLNLDKTVTLGWITTIEVNLQSFIVERSTDMNHYIPIDTVAAVNNGAYTQTYHLDDKTPAVINYYRLRITNMDGSVSYSEPVFIRVTSSNAPLLYPNPAKGQVHVAKGTEPIRLINIYDLDGRLVKSFGNENNNAVMDLPVSSYANGIYILEIRTPQSVYRQKLLVVN
jgi:F5/8 type C domain/Secretion system C-terminal sorting domain